MANGCSGVLGRHRCILTSKAICYTISMLCQINDTLKSATKLGVARRCMHYIVQRRIHVKSYCVTLEQCCYTVTRLLPRIF